MTSETDKQTGASAPAVAARPADSIDMADLVSLVLSLTAPDRDVDVIVDAMLGGKAAARAVDAARVRASFWLRDGMPKYTGGNEALAVLAHRRGYVLDSRSEGGSWTVEAADLVTGEKVAVRHALQGAAGIAGIAALAARASA